MRTTDDKKDNSIRVRVNDSQMEYLESRSRTKGMTISQYLRDMIEGEMRTSGVRETKGSIWDYK